MLFKALFLSAVVLEFVFVPQYLIALWPEKNEKSLKLKMICSGLFVLLALCATEIAGGFNEYAVFMVLGALFGFLGDYFLHAKGTVKYFITGLSSFLIGHIMYLAAFSTSLLKRFSNYSFFSIRRIALYIALISLIFFITNKYKNHFKKKILFVAVSLYAVVIVFMLGKAATLGFNYFHNNLEFRVAVLILLTAGSLLFFISDFTLALLMFGGKKHNYTLKKFNITTYFLAQALLSSSVLFLAQ
jgi:uncharacterized membrane protein YhhN